jgi:hypothetical protein
MLKIHGQDFISFDHLIDIGGFLGLRDEFFRFFAEHSDRCKHFWNAAGIPMDNDWPYLQDTPMAYPLYHKLLAQGDSEEVARLQSFTSREKLIRYMQLRWGVFSPYLLLHFSSSSNSDVTIPKLLRDWIDSLPFEHIELTSFFFTDHYCPLKYHRDYNYFPVEQGDHPEIPDAQHDFIWLRWDLDRGFKLYDISDSGQIIGCVPIEGHSAIFNHYNWHGNTEACERATLTMKIEGRFTESFRSIAYGL